MNLKHIKVALKCIPIYKLLLRHFRLLPLLSSSLVQCTVLEMYRAPCRHVRSGSVMPFDLIAVNTMLLKRRNFCISRASVSAAEGAGRELACSALSSPCLRRVAGSGQLCMSYRDGTLLCCMFYPAKDSIWTLCGTLSSPRGCVICRPSP